MCGAKKSGCLFGTILGTGAALVPLSLCFACKGDRILRGVACFISAGEFNRFAEPGFFVPHLQWGLIFGIIGAKKGGVNDLEKTRSVAECF